MRKVFQISLSIFLMISMISQGQTCDNIIFKVTVDSISIDDFPDLRYRIDGLKRVIHNFDSIKIDSSYVSLKFSFQILDSCKFCFDKSVLTIIGGKHHFSNKKKTIKDVSKHLKKSELIIENERKQFRVFSDGLRKERHAELVNTHGGYKRQENDCIALEPYGIKEFEVVPILLIGLKVSNLDSRVRFHYIHKCNKCKREKAKSYVYSSNWISFK